jgi:MFS family permease
VLFRSAGVVADRVGCRRVILYADALRCADRIGFTATLLLVHRPPTWVFVLFIVVEGAGDGFFFPAFSALIPRLVDDEVLTPANVLMSMARSGSAVIGPSLSGALVAAFGPALVLGLDAASFAVSFVALLGIPVVVPAAASAPKKFRADLREGWSVFAAHPWFWMQTLQFALFNFLVWAPFLVLGPTLSELRYGGARAWGITMGCYGLGSIIGGGLLLRRRRETENPLIVGIICTAAYALAPLGFALRLPLAAIAVLMVACGSGTSIAGALYSTVEQRALPAEALARASSYNVLGAFALGPLGLAIAGPVGGAVGYTTLLGFGVCYQFVSVGLMLAIPAGRRVPADRAARTTIETEAQFTGF